MFSLLKSSIQSDSGVSSRRLILVNVTVILDLIAIAIIVISFKVCFAPKVNDGNITEALSILIKALVIIGTLMLLLAGVITWQNINDTINSVKGLPDSVSKLQTTIQQTVEQVTQQPAAPTLAHPNPPPPPQP